VSIAALFLLVAIHVVIAYCALAWVIVQSSKTMTKIVFLCEYLWYLNCSAIISGNLYCETNSIFNLAKMSEIFICILFLYRSNSCFLQSVEEPLDRFPHKRCAFGFRISSLLIQTWTISDREGEVGKLSKEEILLS
jgi:hypothetical protein